MKSPLTFTLGQRGRALAALALAVLALAILLLGLGSELPTASASALPPARPDNATSAFTSYIFFPFIFNWRPPPVNWIDHFKNNKTGWIAAGDGCTGSYDTTNSLYRVKISSGHKGKSCIVWNTNPSNSPLYPFPRQFYGTFKVKVRRTSSNSYPLLYGLQFDAARDSSDTSGTRWALEEYPQTKDTGCDDGKGFYWLTAQQYKSSTSHTDMYWNHEDDSGHECTSAIDLDQSDWNEMAAVRHGTTVSVYLRDFQEDGDVDDTHTHDYVNVPDIVAKDYDPLGWVQLRVVSYSDSSVTVEFERVEILSSTSAPW